MRLIMRRQMGDFSIPIPASVNNLNAICNINDSNILAENFNMGNILFLQVPFASRQWLLSTIHEWRKWAVWDELIDQLSHCISQTFFETLVWIFHIACNPIILIFKPMLTRGRVWRELLCFKGLFIFKEKIERTSGLPLVVLTLYWKYNFLRLTLIQQYLFTRIMYQGPSTEDLRSHKSCIPIERNKHKPQRSSRMNKIGFR